MVDKLLTNWLSLCMYGYMKKHVGRAFFMLCKAIKHQTEKGPIDVITGEARYSLSEERLLHQKIESRTLVIFHTFITRSFVILVYFFLNSYVKVKSIIRYLANFDFQSEFLIEGRF